MPDIYDIAERHRRALLSRDSATSREIIAAYKSILKNLNGEFRSIHKQITETLLTGQPLRLSWLWERGDRLYSLEQQILAEMQRFSATASEIVTDAQSDLSEMGQSHATRLIESQLNGQSLRAGINVGSRLNRGAVESFVGFASDGSPLADLFNALGPVAARRVREKLVAGIALGWGADRIAREMKDSFGGNLARALTIARTESLRAYRESSHNTYKDNSDVVEGWVWMSARNARTCAMCWAMHGTIHSLDERLASHPNCRCFMLPLTVGNKLKIESGEDSFSTLTQTEQSAILGPGKFKAFRAGLPLRNLVGVRNDSRWGITRYERSLKDASSGEMKGAVTNGLKPKKTVSQIKADKPAKEKVKLFPDGIENLEVVRTLGGSTGAQLMRDPVSGKQFVMKRGANPDHLLEETYADAAYQALGANVPKFKVYDSKEGKVKLAEFIEGQTLEELRRTGDTKAIEKAYKQLQKHFAADALLGNWDVVGLSFDNIIVDKSGKVWRIDNGGGLRYRAQGALKTSFDEFPTELWSMRDQSTNAQTAEIFAKLGIYNISKQIDSIAKKEKKLLASLPPDLRAVVQKRLETMRDVSDYAKDFKQDKWKEGYADEVSRHVVGLRKDGVTDLFPQKLKQRSQSDMTVYDENGKKWDALRGTNSVLGKLENYMTANGGDIGIVGYWQNEQAGSSWSNGAQSFKWFVAEQTNYKKSDFYWQDGEAVAQQSYLNSVQRVGADKYRKSHVIYKAFIMEFMRRVDFDNNDRAAKTLKLIRTEDRYVMNHYNVSRGSRNVIIKRGVGESFSLFRLVRIHGSELITTILPHTRIHGLYFFARKEGLDSCCFYSDNENEINAMAVDIPFDYL